MSMTNEDLELYSARIRLHFEPELREAAFELALGLAKILAAKVKELRPTTPLDEIFKWIDSTEPFPSSLDQVEWLMALQEEMGFEITDSQAARRDLSTFRDLVIAWARNHESA